MGTHLPKACKPRRDHQPLPLIGGIFHYFPQGGPIFSQLRCGRREKTFRLYKFRTMCVDAEKHLEELLPFNEMAGPAFKIQNDPRITRLGRFLRSAGLGKTFNFLDLRWHMI